VNLQLPSIVRGDKQSPDDGRVGNAGTTWLVARLGELLFVSLAVHNAIRNWGVITLFYLLLIGVVVFFLDPIAYASVDDKGITFRRYFRWHFVSWDRVAAVDFATFRILPCFRVALKESTRDLYLFPPGNVKDVLNRFRGRTPEMASWMQQRLHESDAGRELVRGQCGKKGE
jgi:hypothetical protein